MRPKKWMKLNTPKWVHWKKREEKRSASILFFEDFFFFLFSRSPWLEQARKSESLNGRIQFEWINDWMLIWSLSELDNWPPVLGRWWPGDTLNSTIFKDAFKEDSKKKKLLFDCSMNIEQKKSCFEQTKLGACSTRISPVLSTHTHLFNHFHRDADVRFTILEKRKSSLFKLVWLILIDLFAIRARSSYLSYDLSTRTSSS